MVVLDNQKWISEIDLVAIVCDVNHKEASKIISRFHPDDTTVLQEFYHQYQFAGNIL